MDHQFLKYHHFKSLLKLLWFFFQSKSLCCVYCMILYDYIHELNSLIKFTSKIKDIDNRLYNQITACQLLEYTIYRIAMQQYSNLIVQIYILYSIYSFTCMTNQLIDIPTDEMIKISFTRILRTVDCQILKLKMRSLLINEKESYCGKLHPV